MAVVETSELSYVLPGGRVLFQDVAFKVGDGHHAALVGANGVGKTTLLRVIAGKDKPKRGHVHVDGHIGYMPQFIAGHGPRTVRAFLVSLASPRVRSAAAALDAAERDIGGVPDETAAHLAYAHALAGWGEAGGYDAEVLWDTCTTVALALPFAAVADRALSTLSGGEQKRLALEALFRSDADLLLLDEPDNFLDIPGKEWLERTIATSPRTILYVSHDRALLANTSTRVVTLEAGGAWTHPASFATYHDARARRLDAIDEERKLFTRERDRLEAVMKEFKRKAAYNSDMASRAQAAQARLHRFEERNAPRARPRDQDVRIRLGGGRTGKLALRIEALALPGIVAPFDTEILFGERVGIVGPNGSGKSHFVRLLAGEPIAHEGAWKLGARVEPSLFSQLHDRPDLGDDSIVEVLRARGLLLGDAMATLRRYELHDDAHSPFSRLSGGQQARFQLLVMERENPTMLLLDEPTDNLDIDSAEALEKGLAGYQGTVLVVTHDRWFMRLLDRFLVFNHDGTVTEAAESPYPIAAHADTGQPPSVR
ncbi:MAG: ABC-F family ATP-binding cassette domain-containing protein [Actinomycetota bacterium]